MKILIMLVCGVFSALGAHEQSNLALLTMRLNVFDVEIAAITPRHYVSG